MSRFELLSSAFGPNAAIPSVYTCDGGDRSPPLEWRGSPAGTRSFALVVHDPDAPDPAAPKVDWVHWVLYNIPASATSLSENAWQSLPAGTLEGENNWRRTGYGGPCPPIGRHRYFHRVYALDTVLPDLKTPTRDQLEKAMTGHVLATAELMGTYQRHLKQRKG
jgi:Raf kinase inhibitor-like YbhB/YbcL family protein